MGEDPGGGVLAGGVAIAAPGADGWYVDPHGPAESCGFVSWLVSAPQPDTTAAVTTAAMTAVDKVAPRGGVAPAMVPLTVSIDVRHHRVRRAVRSHFSRVWQAGVHEARRAASDETNPPRPRPHLPRGRLHDPPRHLPRIMVGLRNLAIGVHRQDGHTYIAAALRRTSRDHQRPLTALGPT